MSEIIEKSKVIAGYLGWRYIPYSPESDLKPGWYEPSLSKGRVKLDDGKFYRRFCRTHGELRFYNSFDALIPAIEKIENEDLSEYFYTWTDSRGKRSNFNGFEFCRWHDSSEFDLHLELDPSETIGKSKGKGIIKDTFEAVFATIELINQIKENAS